MSASMTEFIDLSLNLARKQQSELQIVNIGFEDCPPSYGYGPTIRPYHLIHFVRSGSGSLKVADMTFSISQGCAFIIPAEKYTYYEASESDPWSYSWVGFIGTSARALTRQLTGRSPEGYVLRDINVPLYCELIRQGAELSGQSLGNHFLANSCLYQIFAHLAEELAIKDDDPSNRSLAEEIKLFLDMKYTEPMRVKDVAGHFHIHPNYLTRLFQKHFSVTPKQYLMDLKLKKACQLLAETDMPVSNISFALGFEDQFSFSRAFHTHVGNSPTNYRRDASGRK